MFRPRERNIAATVPGSARSGRRQSDRPRRVWNPELERLEIRITPATRTWTGLGADNNWTTAANWDVAPAANDDLVFPDIDDSARHTAVNNFASGTPFGSIRIGEAGYTLSGNALSEPGGIFADHGIGTSTINIALNLSSSFPNTLSVQNGGTLVLGGVLSGANGISKVGSGLVLFTQANSYTGVTTVNAGTLAIANSSSLGSSTVGNGTTVVAGATLEIRNTINTSELVSIAGTGVGGVGALFNGTGNNVVQSVTLTDDAMIGVATSTFMLIPSTLAGGAGVDLIKAGNGVLDVLATASYSGTTTIAGGTLAVEGTILNPIVISAGTTLAGAGGTVNALTSTGGTFNPGFATSPFVSNTGNFSLDSTSTFTTNLTGNTPGNGTTGYGQAVVTGSVALGGATLSATIGGSYAPGPGDSLTIISNDGSDAVSGTFAGLPEGAYASPAAGRTFRITYQGGDGNDVVLNYVRETTTTLTSSANPAPQGQGVTFTATVTSTGTTPTNTVNFFDGATLIAANVSLINGVATTPTISGLTLGSHSIAAVYSGDPAHNAGTSAVLTQLVSQPASSTSLTAAPNPSVFGQSVTFTAIVAPGGSGTGTPTGTVNFFDGATSLGTVALVDGTATFQTSTLAAGDHSITASYSGDADLAASLSTATTQTVSRASLESSLVSPANPVEFGQDVTFTATFLVAAPGAGTPTGTVIFFDGATAIGTAPLDGSGTASFLAEFLGIGNHSIRAFFAGDDDFEGATTPDVLQTVDRASSSVVVSGSPSPSVSGQLVTFSAMVSPASPLDLTPGGTVTFFDGATLLGIGTLADGVATFSVPLSAALHSITATYAGDETFAGATSAAVSQVVGRATPGFTLQTIAGRSAFGQPVTLTVLVSMVNPGVGTPTGTVIFFDGASPIGTAPLNAAGRASFTTTALGVGTHAVFASYSGDAEVTPGNTEPAAVAVARAESQAGAVTPSAAQIFFGQDVTLAATFSAFTFNATPMTGTVSFYDGDTLLGTVSLVVSGTSGSPSEEEAPPSVSGQATLATSAFNVGNHVIRAVYSGDGNYLAANSTTSASVQVVPTTTSTTLTVAINPQRTTLTSRITVTSAGSPTVAGTVSFFDGSTLLGTASVADGVATLVVGAFSPGTHAVRAAYSGSENASGSEGLATVEVVDTTVTGTVYLDTNANAVQDAGEPGLAGRVVFLDQNGNGSPDVGESSATTAADGSFSLTGNGRNLTVVEATNLDTSFRYVVAQTRTLGDGSVTLGVVPFSPIATVPVVPNPFVADPAADADAAFVGSLYRAVLGRSGNSVEVRSWLDHMAQGLNRAGVTQGFVNSPEHRLQQVESFYQAFLGRAADPYAGYWINALLAGASEEAVVEAILNSTEYQSAHQDPASFVRDLYLDVLGREGEAPGVAGFEAMLASGVGRASIVSLFVQSAEAVDQVLDGFYSSYLRRGRDPFSRDWAVRMSLPSGSATSVAVSILASDEFFEAANRGQG